MTPEENVLNEAELEWARVAEQEALNEQQAAYAMQRCVALRASLERAIAANATLVTKIAELEAILPAAEAPVVDDRAVVAGETTVTVP